MNSKEMKSLFEDAELVTKIFNSPEIEAAIICGRSVDSAIQDYLERHSLEEVKR